MFKNIMSTEALQFQAGSPLFRELTTVFADLQNKVPFNTTDTYMKRYNLYSAAVETVKLKPRLEAIVKKYLNIPLEVVIYPIDSMAILCLVEPTDFTWDDRAYTLDRYTGSAGHALKYVRPNIVLEQRMDKIGDLSDFDTGKATVNLKDQFVAQLLFNVALLARPEIFLGTRLKPECYAAVVLHEMGHAVQNITKMCWISHCSVIAEDVLKYADERIENQDVVPCLKSCLVILSRVKDSKEKKDITASIQNTLDLIATKPTTVEDYVTVTKFLAKMTTAFCTSYRTADVFKESDFVITDRNIALEEKSSDQFTNRHGAGQYLVEFMTTFTKLYESTTAFSPFSIFRRASGNTSLLVRYSYAMKRFSSSFATSQCSTGGIYDPIVMRLQAIVDDTYAVFKDLDLDPTTRDHFIKAVQAGQASIKEYKDQSYVKTREAIYTFLQKIKSANRDTLLILFNSLIKDYTTLQAFTEDLIKTPLFYQASRVDKILHDTPTADRSK